jgi:penicillin-binding protein 2
MATHDVNLADRPSNLIESHKTYDPRIVFFYYVLAILLVTLAGGLAYQQLFRSAIHADTERTQNQRRVIVPGPRGNIYDREGRLLVTNRARFSVVLYLDELEQEFYREYVRTRKAYRKTGDKDSPNDVELHRIARATVAQHYLDQVNTRLHRDYTIDSGRLRRHFEHDLLLPYTLIDDLSADDYARLIEALPVRSPLQVYASSSRFAPYGSAAAHALGYIRVDEDADVDEGIPGDGLPTYGMTSTVGKDGLERQFDLLLQGEAGTTIYRVDPAGYKVNPPLEKHLPVQGRDLTTSLDIDLQRAAEEALSPTGKPELAQTGAVVALDVATGEVLALVSKPDYDLNQWSPRASKGFVADITARGAWLNLALDGLWSPGSTFKILTTIAGLRRGVLTPDQPIINCDGFIMAGNKKFVCYNGLGHHGDVLLPEAIAHSCDIYFYEAGNRITPDALAAEARRFHLDQPTGIELPKETTGMIIPDTAWKKRATRENWFVGDTYNTSIGQGFVTVTPLQMACFTASVARDETWTQPTLRHDPNRPPQHSEKTGLTPTQRAALLEGMVGCTTYGTASKVLQLGGYRLPGVQIAGKTGTAQKQVTGGKINIAWFICFAPADHPQIAMAVAVVGDTVGESFEGGRNAVPIAGAVLKKYFEKKSHPEERPFTPAHVE